VIHFLQCLWWEWRWRRLKTERRALVSAMPLVFSGGDRRGHSDRIGAVDRELARLEALMSGGGR
jgi:hypothetical protein